MNTFFMSVIVLAAALIAGSATAAISVKDDGGNTVTLAQPAQRLI